MDLFHFSVCVAIITTAVLTAGDKESRILRERLIQQNLHLAPPKQEVDKLVRTLRANGSWPDVNYRDRRTSPWSTVKHVDRALALAVAYCHKEHAAHRDSKVKDAIVRACKHWMDKRYCGRNWWHNDINVPRKMSRTLVFLGDDAPKSLIDQALRTTLKNTKIRMTGQNRVWISGIILLRSLLDNSKRDRQRARDAIFSEIRVVTKEGIQPDWSFHQHGAQQQFGTYGLSFLDSCLKWAMLLRDTPYALDDRQLEILRNYTLNGLAHVLWKGRLDISACGRQLQMGNQARKGRSLLGLLNEMMEVDPSFKGRYQAVLDGKEPVGTTHFWRSDFMVHRRPDWYASVKMSSRRVIGTETCNSENLKGLHLGDGVLLVYLTGKEYENIQPVWNWRQLPGTTCEQTKGSLAPRGKRVHLNCIFAGGLQAGDTGIAAFDYQRGGLKARKSWFFLPDQIMCLGAGITGGKANVITSVEQSLLDGKVQSSKGDVGSKGIALNKGDWVHHVGIGYRLLDLPKGLTEVKRQSGDWRHLFSNRRSARAEKDVFKLYIDHGEQPQNQTYAYAVLPNISVEEMHKKRSKSPKILQNSPALQAVSSSSGLQAVFYEPGQIDWKGTVVKTDAPCILTLSKNGRKLAVSEPTRLKAKVQVTIGGKSFSVKLPNGGDAGKTVVLVSLKSPVQ